MSGWRTSRGSASAEYLALIALVGIVFAGLVSVGPYRVGRHTPVDAVTPILRLLSAPVENLAPTPRPRPVRPRPRPDPPVKRPPRPPDSTVIQLPEWWR